MIKVGEETGQLETMLLRVATVYEKSLREAVKRFVSSSSRDDPWNGRCHRVYRYLHAHGGIRITEVPF